MISRDEFVNRVLSELYEAGEENVSSLLNTVIQVKGNEAELELMCQATLILVQKDLVRLGTTLRSIKKIPPLETESLSKKESIVLAQGMKKYLRYSFEKKSWTFSQEVRPELIVTDAGYEAADKLLSERGYQWWVSDM